MLKSCFTCDRFDTCTPICKFADFITNNTNSTISNECKNWVQKTDKSKETIYIQFIKNEHGNI